MQLSAIEAALAPHVGESTRYALSVARGMLAMDVYGLIDAA
jgi:hypothetical protein